MAVRLSGRTPRPNQKDEPSSQKDPRPPSSGSKLLLWLVIILSLISVGSIGGGLYFFTWGPGAALLNQNTPKTHAKFEIGPMSELGPFTVNLSPIEERRYLRASLTLAFYTNDEAYLNGNEAAKEAWSEELKKNLDKKLPVFKDIVVTTLSKKSAQELGTELGKESLKAELMTRLNAHLKEDTHIKDVYLTDFIIQ